MAACRRAQAFLLTIIFNTIYSSKISDLRLCADKQCQDTISEVSTLMKFDKKDPSFLTFKGGDLIKVKSKSAGTRPDLWGGESTDGRIGYFPKAFVREFRVHVDNPEHLVETEDLSIEKQLGLKPDPSQSHTGDGRGKDDAPGGHVEEPKDDTEIDDTEMHDDAKTDQAEASKPETTDEPPQIQIAEEGKVPPETAARDNDDDDTELDETEFDDDDEPSKMDDKPLKTDNKPPKTDDSKANDPSTSKPEKSEPTNSKDDTDLGKESEDDTDFADGPDNEIEDEDFLLGLEELDNYFDIHENVDEPGELEGPAQAGGGQEEVKPTEGGRPDDVKEVSSQGKQSGHVQDGPKLADSPTGNVEQVAGKPSEGVSPQDQQKQPEQVQHQVSDPNVQQMQQKLQQEKQPEQQQEKQLPTGQQPSGQQQPSTGQQQPPVGQQQPPVGQQQPPTGQQQQPSGQQQQPSGQQQPSTGQQQPPTGQQQPPASQQQPPVGQQQPPTGHQQPLTGQQLPPEGQQQPMGQQPPPTGQQPTGQQEDKGQHSVQGGQQQATAGQQLTEAQKLLDPHHSGDQAHHQAEAHTATTAAPAVAQATSQSHTEAQKTVTAAEVDNAVKPGDAGVEEKTTITRPRNTDPKKPDDVGSTSGDAAPKEDSKLASSMEDRGPEKATPTPGLNVQKSEVPSQSATDEAYAVNPKETVIDGTTIPLDDYDGQGEMTSPQEAATASQSASTVVTPTQSHYTPQASELPFADENNEFQKTPEETPTEEKAKPRIVVGTAVERDEPADNEDLEDNGDGDEDEEANEQVEEKSNKNIQIEDADEGAVTDTVIDLPVNDSKQAEDAKIPIEPTVEQMYNSEDFHSRKPLSASHVQTPPMEGNTQPPPDQADQPASGQDKEQQASQPLVVPSEPDRAPEASLSSEATTTQTPDLEEIPAPPLDTLTPPTSQVEGTAPETQSEAPPPEDAYKTGHHNSRQFTDDHLEEEGKGPVGTGGYQSRINAVIALLPPSVVSLLEQEPMGLSPTMCILVTMTTLLSLVIVALVGCVCGGGQKANKKDPLVVVREIEEKLFIATKEKENLEDEILQIKTERTKLERQLVSQESKSGNYVSNLQNVQLHNEALKQQVSLLEAEVSDLSTQLSSSSVDTSSKDKQVKDLQKQLSKLEGKHKKAEEQLAAKSQELKDSNEDMVTLKGQILSLSEQVKQLEVRKQQLLSEADDWKEKVDDVNERLQHNSEEYKQMQEALTFKDTEMEVLRDCFRQLKTLEGDYDDEGERDPAQVEEKITSMMDVSRVNASLRGMEEERNSLENRLQIETDGRKEMEDQLEKCQRDIETLQTDKMKSERQCQEAQMKLNVLSNYFKEKEAQLQRELGEHEALKRQNCNKLENIDEHAKMMEQEVEMYKAQNDGMKRELTSSERDFRSQIAANEKKAHENWLAARAAERELKEVRHDAQVLRQKLTDLERRQAMGPGGLIRPLPTRGIPPPGLMNGPPPPGMERSPSRGTAPPPHLRDDEMRGSPHGDRGPLPPDRRPPPPGGRLPPHFPPDGRSPPPGGRMPPPMDRRSPPPFDRRPPPHLMDRRTPPYRPPPPDMMHRGPPFSPRSPPPRMPPPHGMDPRMDPHMSTPNMRPPPPGQDGRSPRQHSQV